MAKRERLQAMGLCGARYSEDTPWYCHRSLGHDGEHSASIDSIEWDDDESLNVDSEAPDG